MFILMENGVDGSDRMTDYEINGNFRVIVEAESKEEAFKKLDEMKIIDLDRVDVNDIVEW